ncbi:Serine/threonine-protein kinase PknB [Aquisphaera giovannonii]|uniref:Serine/threonine-protein kinase PknB n=1 Tax=Aquisphaera giovannonii TaxID=406548 RepID=A0A5B9WAT2_9BACT|nr:serine/threonine-protein kinase [Aquisphaera giovannonii]QEH37686.1 Serine/threonine-protein kinase PknB [Aquisphaera giovannonii]
MSEVHGPPAAGELTPAGSGGGSDSDELLLGLILRHQRHAWRRGERARVAAYLDQHAALGRDPAAVLDLIYNEVLLREEAGEVPLLEEYIAEFPGLAPELRLQFEVEDAIRGGRLNDAEDEPTLADRSVVRSALPRPVIPGYEILEELGRGGMGVVHRARQLRLNRIVAIKTILAGDHATPQAAARFLAEAEAVARLQHPNIVQIFALGEHEGRPYFEMEYVPGGSLAGRMRGQAWAPRDAAQTVEILARAIHEAHEIGIIHRDLKPANILMTADGAPKIADFGLAKWVEVETGLTKSEWIVGSPHYMAPEQAGGTGGREAVGRAADVYSLGAILYELLTGQPPFRGATVLETLEQVKFAAPHFPSRLRPSLPRDLVTVCLKCLEKQPLRRYAGADILAEELRRFLEGRTIQARRPALPERAWRWARREPALALLALSLVAGLAGVSSQWWRAESHLGEALRHRRLAQGRLDVAMKSFERVEALAGDPALHGRRQEGVRGQLLGTLLEVYKKLQESLAKDDSAEARVRLSKGYQSIARIAFELGRLDEALAASEHAVLVTEQTNASKPGDPLMLQELASAHARQGFSLRVMGRSEEAFGAYDRARSIQERLAKERPSDEPIRSALAGTYSNLGLIELELGRPEEAVALHARAIQLREAPWHAHPGDAASASDMAWAVRYRAQATAAMGRMDEARRLIEEAISLLEPHAGAPDAPQMTRWRLARCFDELGRIRMASGRFDDAASPLERASRALEALDGEYPAFYYGDFVRNQMFLATQRTFAGQPEAAAAFVRRAHEILARSAKAPREEFLLDLACGYALWSVSCTEGNVDPMEREHRAGRAVAAIRRWVTERARGADLLRRDPALAPLRGRPDFLGLIKDLSVPADPPGR